MVPWYFPSAAAYRECLLERGFEVRRIESFARPTPLPTDVHGWLVTFADVFTAPLPASQRADFIDEVTETLHPRHCGADAVWIADYVRLRFIAVRPD